jgi:2',3'-cyclic-nucleotide 2'-phosphodiesterase (5'-nucleotidase family)
MSIRLWLCWGIIPLVLTLLAGNFLLGKEQQADKNLPALIVFSSDQNGYITPCGCAKPMLGGMPRRADYLRETSLKYNLLLLENGNLTKAINRQDELKAETLIEMFDKLRYDVINLGEKDFKLGMSYLKALQPRFRGTFLCANVKQSDGSYPFKPYTMVEKYREGKTISFMVVGVLTEKSETVVRTKTPDLQVETISDTLGRLRNEISGKGNMRILLLQGSREEAEQIAREHPYFHIIVYSQAGDHWSDVKRIGETALVHNGSDGKYIGQAALSDDSKPGEIKYVTLTPDYKDDPAMLQIKEAYLARVAAENLLAQVPKGPTANGDVYAGSEACAGCHKKAYQVWKGSRHGDALQTLIDEKHDKDPECVVCHVVGLEHIGGFENMEKTPKLKDVGCESCHGPSAKHVEEPSEYSPRLGNANTCMQCHVPEHSPKFDFPTYWEKIKH